jgi:hypothetical protein
MLIELLLLGIFAAYAIRVILVKILKTRGLKSTVFDSIRNFRILFPIKNHREYDSEMRSMIRIANIFVYLIWILFLALILFGLASMVFQVE